MKNIAILTSGGDSPGMNAAIRSIVRTANHKNIIVHGIEYGYRGLINNEFKILTHLDVGNTIHIGGTFLKTARSDEFRTTKGRKVAFENLKKRQIEGLIILGGDGSLTGATIFKKEFNFPIIGIPCTIDNDIYGTDFSIGFATARETIVSSIDKIRDTASSHDRIFVIEVMGRYCGNLALESGISSGAEMILIPEINLNIDKVIKNLSEICKRKKSVIIVYAEGCNYGPAYEFAKIIEDNINNSNVRFSILGHIQRGGIPASTDRILGSLLGHHSVNYLNNGETDKMIGINNNNISLVTLTEATSKKKSFNLNMYNISELISKH